MRLTRVEGPSEIKPDIQIASTNFAELHPVFVLLLQRGDDDRFGLFNGGK